MKRLVLVGGGHAHLTALMNIPEYIKQGHSVTVVSPAVHHYYSGMGPGLLSKTYKPQEVRFNIKKMVEGRGAQFVLGSVTRILPEEKTILLDTETKVPYDVISFNTGSSVPYDLFSHNGSKVFAVKPIVNLLKAQKTVLDGLRSGRPRIAIIGGGPAGVELTGNIEKLVRDNSGSAKITLVAGSQLLANVADKAAELARKSLQARGVEVLERVKVVESRNSKLILSNGSIIDYDIVFSAMGVKPSRIFADSGLPVGKDGGLLVNQFLQSPKYPEMFGGGDCIFFEKEPLDKVGVYAVRQNPILRDNLTAALNGGELKAFEPQKIYMLIFNMGDGTGIFMRKNFVWQNRLMFKLKDYIDRKFMKEFQVSGELNEDTPI